MKVLPSLFNPDAIITRFGDTAINALPFEETRGFMDVFADKFADRVVLRDPSNNKRVTTRGPLDLSDFDWADIPMPQESVYQFKGRLFYRRLLILPIYSYGAVEFVTVPPIDQVIPFAESNIDSVHVNRLLSQLHWQIGDRVSHADGLYQLKDIQIENGSVSAIRIQYPPANETTMGSPLVDLSMNELQRKFLSGDNVVVVAGLHKGLTGSVLRDEDGILHILTDDDGDYVSMPNHSTLFITDVHFVPSLGLSAIRMGRQLLCSPNYTRARSSLPDWRSCQSGAGAGATPGRPSCGKLQRQPRQ
jgi:hypothetical protein